MKVCLLTTSFPRFENDFKSPFILDLAQSIQKRGIDISIVGMHIPGTDSVGTLYTIPVRRLHYFFERFEKLQSTKGGIPAEYSKNKLSVFLVFLFLVRLTIYLIINGRKYDIIHANWTLASLAAVLSKPFHQRPVVTTLHGSDIFSALKFRQFKIPTFIALNGSNLLICVSTALKTALENMGIPSPKIKVVPNGVDAEKFFNREKINRKKNILYVGSLTKNKGVHLLLEAFSKLSYKYPGFRLVITGDGPEEENLRNLSEKLLIKNKVDFYGSKPHDEIGSIMSDSFLFVLPSKDEGFGVVLIEALASGLPCVAFNSGGVKDILSNNNGILVEPENVSELSCAIEKLITNRNLYKQLSANGIDVAKEYKWDTIAEKIIEIYYSIK